MSDVKTGTLCVRLTGNSLQVSADIDHTELRNRQAFIAQVRERIPSTWNSVGHWEIAYDLDGNIHNLRQLTWGELLEGDTE